jgi:hypothetical protein
VASNIWDDERPDNPLPPEYLPGRAKVVISSLAELPGLL